MFVHDGGKGVQLSDVREFCTSSPGDDDDCVTSFFDSSASCVSREEKMDGNENIKTKLKLNFREIQKKFLTVNFCLRTQLVDDGFTTDLLQVVGFLHL